MGLSWAPWNTRQCPIDAIEKLSIVINYDNKRRQCCGGECQDDVVFLPNLRDCVSKKPVYISNKFLPFSSPANLLKLVFWWASFFSHLPFPKHKIFPSGFLHTKSNERQTQFKFECKKCEFSLEIYSFLLISYLLKCEKARQEKIWTLKCVSFTVFLFVF